MTERRYDIEGNWIDPDDAPEWTDEMFDRAEVRLGDTVVRPAGSPKQPISIRLDEDVLAHFRAGGPGWQTRINEALRRAAGV